MAQGELCGEAAARGKLSGQDKGSVQEAQEKPLPPHQEEALGGWGTHLLTVLSELPAWGHPQS